MAEKETKNRLKDLIEPVPEEITKLEKAEAELKANEEPEAELPAAEVDERIKRLERRENREAEELKRSIAAWVPKTKLGKLVKSGEIKNIDEIINSDQKILEAEMVDSLIPLQSDLLLVGQSKGKFGGGKRRAWRQTQRKTMEGNVVTFSCVAVVGDKNGHVGVGIGKAKETLPSRAKALRNARLEVIKITRGFETQEEKGNNPHTIPFVVEGKCGSVRIKLMPAPRGTGLVISDEGKKILRLAGIDDIYSVSTGQTRTTFNVAQAIIDALKKTNVEVLK
ncbi:MAG: 30S ribosomal protein S5 [archaeon]